MNLQKEKQKSHQEDDLFDIQTVSNDFFNIGFIPKSPKSDVKYEMSKRYSWRFSYSYQK